jgi:hypothetical protein
MLTVDEAGAEWERLARITVSIPRRQHRARAAAAAASEAAFQRWMTLVDDASSSPKRADVTR